MTYKNNLKLDRAAAAIMRYPLRWLTLLCGAILRKDHSIYDLNGKTVVICKIVGMGSIVEFSPSLYAIKQRFPECKVVFLTSKKNKAILDLYPGHIDDCIMVDDSSIAGLFKTTIGAIYKLNRFNIDTFINLEVYSFYSSLLSVFSRARNRFGFYRNESNFRKGIDTHLVFFNTQKNIKEIYSQIIEELGVSGFDKDRYLEFFINKSCEKKVKSFLDTHGIKEYVILNTNCSDLMPERRWPKEYWKKLLDYFLNNTGLTILFSGTKEEAGDIEKYFGEYFNNEIKRVYNIAGEFTLSEFIYCLRGTRLLISNDSGPLHLAFVEKVQVISLWGPTDPGHLSVNSPLNKEIYKNVYCSPCLHHVGFLPCKGKNYLMCMNSISVLDVIEKVHEFDNGEKERRFS
jgi:ADP-heptose:LPS heptosyltransferase